MTYHTTVGRPHWVVNTNWLLGEADIRLYDFGLKSSNVGFTSNSGLWPQLLIVGMDDRYESDVSHSDPVATVSMRCKAEIRGVDSYSGFGGDSCCSAIVSPPSAFGGQE